MGLKNFFKKKDSAKTIQSKSFENEVKLKQNSINENSAPQSGVERFNHLREMLSYAQTQGNIQVGNFAYYALISYFQEASCILLSPEQGKEKTKQLEVAKQKYQDDGVALIDFLLKNGLITPMTTTNPSGEQRLAVFLSKEQIPLENVGMIQIELDFKLACVIAKAGNGIGAIVIDYSSINSMTITSEMIDAILGPKVEIKPKDTSNVSLTENDNQNIAMARSIIQEQEKQHSSLIADKESSTKFMSDSELLAIFAEHFAFGMKEGFITQPGSPKYKAYFDAINAATLELVNNPHLYSQATKRNQAELVSMCNNRIPGLTNSLICSLIYCMGKYAVVNSAMLCVDFAEAIPNCIAVYLMLAAQKLPPNNRKQMIDAGDGVNKQPLTNAMNLLSVCDPNWKYQIF